MRWRAGEGAGSPGRGKAGPGGLLAGEGSEELGGEGDGVAGLMQEQGLEEVSQQRPELGVLPDVSGVGCSQLLLRWGGQGGHRRQCPPPATVPGGGREDAWVLFHT